MELKFGGSLTEEELQRCERQTLLNSPRWTPYPWRSPVVENICGKFMVRVEGRGGGSMKRGKRGSGSSVDLSASEVSSDSDLGIPRSNPNVSNSCQGASCSQDLMDLACEFEEGVRESPKHTKSPKSGPNDPNTPIYTSCLSDRQLTVNPRLRSVCFDTETPFGKQQEILHIDGHITARCTPGLPRSLIFKGAKGMDSVSRLMRDLFLDQEKTIPLVHMGVVSSCLGVRLQTSECCYLENRVLNGTGIMRGGWMTVETRAPDQCNVVRLSVTDWTGLLLPVLIPVTNDIVITGKGSIVHRFSWIGLSWNQEVERDILDACESVASAIASVC